MMDIWKEIDTIYQSDPRIIGSYYFLNDLLYNLI